MSQAVTLEEGRAYVFVAVEHANSKSSAFTPPVQPIASRRWSRSEQAGQRIRLYRARRGAFRLRN